MNQLSMRIVYTFDKEFGVQVRMRTIARERLLVACSHRTIRVSDYDGAVVTVHVNVTGKTTFAHRSLRLLYAVATNIVRVK